MLALAGELLDCACLAAVIRALEDGTQGPWPRRTALVSAAVQGATIAGCVILCWRGISLIEARFFASAFLISATINAGLARPHLRAAADVRLAIFVTVLIFACLRSEYTLLVSIFWVGWN